MFIIFSWAPDTLYLQIAEFLSLANASTTSEGDKGKLVLRNASRLSNPSRVPNAIDEALGVKGLRIWVDILTKGPPRCRSDSERHRTSGSRWASRPPHCRVGWCSPAKGLVNIAAVHPALYSTSCSTVLMSRKRGAWIRKTSLTAARSLKSFRRCRGYGPQLLHLLIGFKGEGGMVTAESLARGTSLPHKKWLEVAQSLDPASARRLSLLRQQLFHQLRT